MLSKLVVLFVVRVTLFSVLFTFRLNLYCIIMSGNGCRMGCNFGSNWSQSLDPLQNWKTCAVESMFKARSGLPV